MNRRPCRAEVRRKRTRRRKSLVFIQMILKAGFTFRCLNAKSGLQQTLRSIATGTNDLKSRRACGLRLPVIVRHQARDFEFLHRSQMQPIQRATVNRAGIAMLPKRRLKESGRQSPKLVRRLIAQHRQLRFQLPPTRARIITRQIKSFQLNERFQFGKHRDND